MTQQTVLTDEPVNPAPDYSEMSRDDLERHATRMAQMLGDAKQREFYEKYAFDSKSAPSCICCGHVPEDIAVRHADIPAIVVCKRCHEAATQPAEPVSGLRERDLTEALANLDPLVRALMNRLGSGEACCGLDVDQSSQDSTTQVLLRAIDKFEERVRNEAKHGHPQLTEWERRADLEAEEARAVLLDKQGERQ